MKFIRYGEGYNCNNSHLDDIGMIFAEPLVKDYLTRPHFYEYIGNYIRLTLLEDGSLSVGTQDTYQEDDTTFIDRSELIRVLEELEDLKKQKFQVYYLLKENDHLKFTDKFPTRYASFLKIGENYQVAECDDPDLKILAEFFSYYKKTDSHDDFLKDKRLFVQKVNWVLHNLRLKSFGDEVRIVNEKEQEIKIGIQYLTDLMTEWQKLLKEGPEKIYLVLEDGLYRLTTDYKPKNK